MPRSAHLHYPGGVFHVVARCTGGAFLIRGDTERAHYLELLGKALAKTDAKLLAYCLMSNHVHLVVVHGQEPLERLLKPVHTGFALRLHRAHGRRKRHGPVFADRPRRVLVQEDAYLLQLVRYVHNNPVRAGVATDAASVSSQWSSHRAYVGRVEAPEWLNLGYVLQRFGKRPNVARQRFEDFVREGAGETRRTDFAGEGSEPAVEQARQALGDGWRLSDPVLGDAGFARRIARDVTAMQRAFGGGALSVRPARSRQRPLLRDVVDVVCGALELEAWEFENRPKCSKSVLARQLCAWIWIHHLGGKQIELARELRAGTWAVTRWYGRAVALAPHMEELALPLLGRWRGTHGGRRAGRVSRVHYQVSLED